MTYFVTRAAFFLALLVTMTACGPSKGGTGSGVTFGDIFGKIFGCTISGAFAALEAGIDLEMEQSEFSRFLKIVADKKITNESQFFNQISPADAAALKSWISDGFDRLDAKSKLRGKSKEYYSELFAFGLIQIVKNKYQVGQYNFSASVGVKEGSTIHYSNYSLNVKILHPDHSGNQGIGRCD